MTADLMTMLLRMTLASTIAVALVFALRKPLRGRFGAHVAYWLWVLVPLAIGVALIPAPIGPPVVQPAIGPISGAPFAIMSSPHFSLATFDTDTWLMWTWIVGTLICVTLLAIQQRRFMTGLGRLSQTAHRVWRAQNVTSCPALIGAWHPRIVLPEDFDERYTAAERELILAHERTHISRADVQINLIASGLRCVFWFNPLFHFAASRFRFDQELACDAAVIAQFPEARRSYADAMLKTQLADFGLPVGCHWQSSHPLKERISMLKTHLPSRARRRLGVTIALSLVTGVTAAGWAAQPKRPATEPDTKPVAEANALAADSNHANRHATYRSISRITYPDAQANGGVDATVLVLAHISVEGKVVSTEAKSGGDSSETFALRRAALEGVQKWTFNPAMKKGKPVASDELIPIVFSTRADETISRPDGALDPIRVNAPEPVAENDDDVGPSENTEFRKFHPPQYPRDAIAAHQSGKIILKVLVDERGLPQSAEVEKAEPAEAAQTFGDVSIATVMQWTFTPGRKGGKAAAGYVMVPITYTLTDDES
ncbi:MAG: TonB family protein [Rudaea sp.]